MLKGNSITKVESHCLDHDVVLMKTLEDLRMTLLGRRLQEITVTEAEETLGEAGLSLLPTLAMWPCSLR